MELIHKGRWVEEEKEGHRRGIELGHNGREIERRGEEGDT